MKSQAAIHHSAATPGLMTGYDLGLASGSPLSRVCAGSAGLSHLGEEGCKKAVIPPCAFDFAADGAFFVV